MEIDRPMLRKRAREALKGIYWFMFAACIVAVLVGAAGESMGINFSFGGGTASHNTENIISNELPSAYPRNYAAMLEELKNMLHMLFADPRTMLIAGAAAALILSAVFGIIVFGIFISGPAEVSFARVKLSAVVNRQKNGGEAFYAFKSNYKNILKTTVLKNFIIWLWSLPSIAVMLAGVVLMLRSTDFRMGTGILASAVIAALLLLILPTVAQYRYMLVPYIMAEDSAMGAIAALRASGRMMSGFKWQAFLLRLSFIGWYILGALLCGAGILFVNPYYHTAETLLYTELKDYYLADAQSAPDGEADEPEPTEDAQREDD